MKLEINKRDLLDALKILKPIIKSDELELCAVGGNLYAMVTDARSVFLAIRVKEGETETGFGIAPLALTKAICEEISLDTLIIETKTGGVRYRAGDFQKVKKVEDRVMSISRLDSAPEITVPVINPAALRDALSGVSASLPGEINNATAEIQHITESLSQVRFVVKDGRVEITGGSQERISQAIFECDQQVEFEGTIPNVGVAHLLRLLKESDESSWFGFSTNRFFFRTETINYQTPLATKPYPSLPPAFFDTPERNVRMESAKLKESVKLTGLGLEGTSAVNFECSSGVVNVSSLSKLGEAAKYPIRADYDGEAWAIPLRKNLILDVITVGEEITMGYMGADKPTYWSAERSGVQFRHCVMPMRVQ
jgi:hypothetical protein